MAQWRDRLGLGLLSVCLVTTGCGAATRRSLGATMMGMGAVTGLVSVHVMVGGCTRRSAGGLPDATGERLCNQYADPDPTAGALVLTAGLTAVVAGGILLASGMQTPPPPAQFSK